MKFVPKGRTDSCGHRWHIAVDDEGNPVIERGVVLQYKAADPEHAQRIHEQLKRIKETRQ